MTKTMLKTIICSLLAAAVLLPSTSWAFEKVGGVRVYKKGQTPRRVTNHAAYPLRRGGDTWLFSSSKRKAQHKHYVRYCKANLSNYEGQRIDCADVALDNVLNFAKQRGLRVTFKVYQRGWKYVDSAQFRSFGQLKTWAKRYLGAHNVTDNSKLIKPLAGLTTPAAWANKVQPGDLLMWSYNKPSSSHPGKPGRPTRTGHTQPIMDVQQGSTLANTRLKLMNGDIQLSTGEALPASTSFKAVSAIHAVAGGKSLSNYPQYNGQLFKVLQKYNWNRPIGDQAPPQSSQGPLRFALFK